MSFATEALENLDKTLATVEQSLRAGDVTTALQGVYMIRGRLPRLIEGVRRDEERRYG